MSPVFTIGPEQYGYAFFGLCSLLGQFAKLIGAESPVWLLILNLGIIGIMILFSVAGLAALISPISMALLNLKEKTKTKIIFLPLVFAGIVLLGLIGASLFPGNPEIEIGSEFYLSPSLLLLASVIGILVKNKTEPGSGINSVTAPPPLRDTL